MTSLSVLPPSHGGDVRLVWLHHLASTVVAKGIQIVNGVLERIAEHHESDWAAARDLLQMVVYRQFDVFPDVDLWRQDRWASGMGAALLKLTQVLEHKTS